MQLPQKIQSNVVRMLAGTHRERAATHLTRGELYETIHACNLSIRAVPDRVAPYILRGRAHYRLGNFDQALADFDHALTLDGKLAEIYVNRGLVFHACGDSHEALADFNLAIFYDPRQALAYNNRGLVTETLGNLVGAIADYSKAIQINPNIAVAYNNRGGARFDRGDLRGAIADFQRYVALGGSDHLRIRALIASLRGKLECQTQA